MLSSITVLGTFVLTLNWESAAFFRKSNVHPVNQCAHPSKSQPERSNWHFII